MKKTLCLVGLLLGFVFIVQPGFAAGDCYPGNGILVGAGPTSANGEVNAHIVNINSNRHSPSDVSRGGADINLEFNANIGGLNSSANNGTSTGGMTVTISWADPSKTGGIAQTVFHAGCVEFISTYNLAGFPIGGFDGVFEGPVENFPGYPKTSKAAVARVQVFPDPSNPGRVEVDFEIELGYTCFLDVYPFSGNAGTGEGTIEISDTIINNLDPEDFKINNNGTHGRLSDPDNTSCGIGGT
jgi:hypothetical protein